jgi:hypothetical protein
VANIDAGGQLNVESWTSLHWLRTAGAIVFADKLVGSKI